MRCDGGEARRGECSWVGTHGDKARQCLRAREALVGTGVEGCTNGMGGS